jgi:hypothetical protein
VWASSSLTEAEPQGVMNSELLRLVFNRSQATLGDAVIAAKRAVADLDVRRSWIFFGDPAMRLKDVAVVSDPPESPVITEAPRSRTINPNVLTTFTASATGSVTPSEQWQVSSNGGATWTEILGETANSYMFMAQASDNGKLYRAMFRIGANGTATSAALLTVRPVAQPARRADLDGDGASDVVVWRPSTGTWYAQLSSAAFTTGFAAQWGDSSAGDHPFLGDMDGDGIADLIVWRPTDATWYWLASGTGYASINAASTLWGSQALGDVPMVADMDGDGKADLVIWRPTNGTWYWLTSSSGYSYESARGIQWGSQSLGDRPLLGDFDGDGKQDPAVWRASTGTWYWLPSSTDYSYASARGVQWGSQGQADVPFTGDIDGDGRSELIVWRPATGTWFWLTSSSGYSYGAQQSKLWGSGAAGDVPLIGDFDADGKADLAVWRAPSGTWFWLTSSSGYNYAAQRGTVWGASTDIPMVK